MGEVKNGSAEASGGIRSASASASSNSDGKMRDVNDVLNDVSDGLKKTAPGAERMAAAFGVMGKGGAEAIPMLGEGSAELKRMREEFRLTVGTLTADQVKMLDTFDDSLVTLRAVKDFLVHDFALPIVEALQPVIDRVIAWRKANKQLIDNTVANWGKKVADVVTAIAKGVETVIANWTRIVAIIKTIGLTMLALGAIMAGLQLQMILAAVSAAAAWLAAAAPVIAMTVALALLVLVVDDVIVALQGGHSLIGELGPKWTKFMDEFTKVKPDDPWWLKDLKLALGIITDIQGFIDSPTSFFHRKLGPAPGPRKESSLDVEGQMKWLEANPDFMPTDEQRKGGMQSSAEIRERLFPSNAITDPRFGPIASVQPPNFSSSVQVTVNATPNQSAAEIGSEVAKHVDQAIGKHLREVKGNGG
jgi:hypothetical protein